MKKIRLDKFIADNTIYSRRDAKNLIKYGKIKVNGITVRDADAKINAENDSVMQGEQPIKACGFGYVILNKPKGAVCSTRDDVSKTVLDIVSEEIAAKYKGLAPAGRLDKDSEGFVLLTNDGELTHKILSPKSHIPKFYMVKLHKPFEESYIRQFEQGIVLENGERCLPAHAESFENIANSAFICLHEGKYHQIKRMFAAVENHVEYLFRTQLGNLIMPDNIALGEYMAILHKDVEKLFEPSDFYAAKSSACAIFSSYLINT